MTKSLRILVADDTPENLQAARRAVEELKGLDVVGVEIEKVSEDKEWSTPRPCGMHAYVTPLGVELPEYPMPIESYFYEVIPKWESSRPVFNELLRKGKFPYRNVHKDERGGELCLRISPLVRIGAEFTDKASVAMKAVYGSFDGIVTDMFFPEEDDPDLTIGHLEYLREMLEKRGAEEMTMRLSHGKQKAYGGPVMIEAYDKSVPAVLITDMHRHGFFDDAKTVGESMHGTLVLHPLCKRGIIEEYEAGTDVGSRYVGHSYGGSRKQFPEGWKVALGKVIMRCTE